MNEINSLKHIIKFNNNFKTSINLYLNLNKYEKINGYIPTKSSVKFMNEYMESVVANKEQATLMIGPYGKGKSHLLLVLLSVLTMDRTEKNKKIIETLIKKVKEVDEVGIVASKNIEKIWGNKPFLPILISSSTGELEQAFLYGLNDALKREGLTELVPDTFYTIATERIKDWADNYIETYEKFEKELLKYNTNIDSLKTDLKEYSREALDIFKSVYPNVTSGSEFNPMAVSDVLPLYKNISEKLVEEYNYSGIYIVFDEFSKFIESQNGIATGKNMKLLQDMCELATDSSNAKIFLTLVAHKSIKEYGKYLSSEIINSFTGIEGRLIEKYFITSSKNNYELIKNAIIKETSQLELIPHYESVLGKKNLDKYYQLPAFRSNFLEGEFENIVLKGCYPLNPIASYLLLHVSEKVAQNERTLFTFISNDEPHSMARFVREHTSTDNWSIGVDLVYDYFDNLFKKEISNEYVHNIWLSTEYCLSKCETEDEKKIIKALATILIVNKEDEIPANKKYLSMCVNATDATQTIEELVKKQMIYKKSSTGSYVFKTRAGSELKSEIRKQRELKGNNINYSNVLSLVTGKYYVVPRKYNAVNMMTRYFTNEFMDADDFLNISTSEAFLDNCVGDGKVITLYSFSKIKQDVVKKHILELAEQRLVVVCPKKVLKVQKQLKDYEIIQDLRKNQVFNDNNEILKKELPLLVEDLSKELEDVLDIIYEDDSETKVFYFDGNRVKNIKNSNVEKAVNECCRSVYTRTPIINNEIVNRSEITTSQTKKSRLNVIEKVLRHEDDENYYSGSNQEATIYRSIYCKTGIATNEISGEINDVITEINNYVDSCSDEKQPISKLITILCSAPYGMRKGVIPFYLAYVLANRKEDIIVYFAGKEVQLSSDIIVNMCEDSSDYTIYVSKEDLQKEKYINELNILFQITENRNLSSNRIKDIVICMQRWFRALPQVSRNIVDIDKYINEEEIVKAMKSIRKSMQKVEFNPFEILFISFPKAFNTSTLEDTFEIIEICKSRYDSYFEWIQIEAIKRVYSIWNVRKNQNMFHVLKEWHERQSKRSKQGLYDGRLTSFMSCIESLDVYSNPEIVRKIVKSVTDVYIEDWNTGALDEFEESLSSIKQEIESIKDEEISGEMTLSFVGRNGETINKIYSHANEGSGSVLKNILEDYLDEFDDLSVNDRVSILLQMIEKVIK